MLKAKLKDLPITKLIFILCFLVFLVYANMLFNFLFWKGQVFGFHLFQLIVHLGNTILVFLILKALFEKEKVEGGQPIAFVTSLIFGIHPGIAEAVVYISATHDVLFAFFCLLALWLIVKKNRYALWLLGPLFFFSLLSKEAAITGGGVVLLIFFLFKNHFLAKSVGNCARFYS